MLKNINKCKILLNRFFLALLDILIASIMFKLDFHCFSCTSKLCCMTYAHITL